MKIVKGLIAAIALMFMAYMFWGGGVEKQAATEMQKIENSVAEDAVKQYEIAKQQGDKMQIYVQAQLVATAYLQAKDQDNYNKWKKIEADAAKDAGMPEAAQ